MADQYASGFSNPNLPQKALDDKGARVRTTPSIITTAAAVIPANDRILICRIPTNARLVDLGKVSYGAAGGAAAASLGFDHVKMTSGQRTTAAAKLWSAQSIVAAGSRQVMAGVATTDLNKRAWQLAGLSADPGGEFDVVMTITTATANIITVFAEVTFTND
jgi:hypothetical protein